MVERAWWRQMYEIDRLQDFFFLQHCNNVFGWNLIQQSTQFQPFENGR